MARPIINGSLQPQRKTVKTRFNRGSGFLTTEEYESAGDNLGGLASQLRQKGVEYDHTASPIKSTLVATYSGPQAGNPDVVLDRWDVLYNENQMDIKEHRRWIALPLRIRTCVLRNKAAHEDETKKAPGDGYYYDDSTGDLMLYYSKTEHNEIMGDSRQPFQPEITSDEGNTAFQFYRMMIRGVTHFIQPNWVLRHTTNASADYERNVADSGVLSVYSTSQLLSEISDSNYWLYPAPARLRAKISGFSYPSASGITVGWLKKPSCESSAPNNRIDISTEYVFAQWSSVLYT